MPHTYGSRIYFAGLLLFIFDSRSDFHYFGTFKRPYNKFSILETAGSNDSNLSKVRILAAEDNSVNRFVLVKMLKKWNIEPTIVSDGALALEAFEQHDYDIIFLDLQMPIMDGLEASRKMREKNQDVPIIALTAAVLQENRNEASAAGMNDFIEKPFQSEDLREIILKYVPVL